MASWIVFAGFSVAMIENAASEEIARHEAEKLFGTENRPWLSREWIVRLPTADEVRWYIAQAKAHRPSEPTAKTAARANVKRPRKDIQQRLL